MIHFLYNLLFSMVSTITKYTYYTSCFFSDNKVYVAGIANLFIAFLF